MWEQPLESRRDQLPFKRYFHVRFSAAILNWENVNNSLDLSENVDSIIFKSGKAENMRVKVGIAAPSLTVQKLFPLPV